jgi:hypothetical protein
MPSDNFHQFRDTTAYAYAGRVMAESMMARDTEAGIGAFIWKEPMPEWTGE